ncbi:unnamed protein product [Blepharisma stoltei]|uniref:Uncharacterized protein n=1 Tax=Blepharisma stoltei TaxID=1481888 RepID=A0AAU9KEP7_9CILI|nr:unnamed protein product [Blepharisma stoltei]
MSISKEYASLSFKVAEYWVRPGKYCSIIFLLTSKFEYTSFPSKDLKIWASKTKKHEYSRATAVKLRGRFFKIPLSPKIFPFTIIFSGISSLEDEEDRWL